MLVGSLAWRSASLFKAVGERGGQGSGGET